MRSFVSFALKCVTHHVLKRCYEGQTKGHKAEVLQCHATRSCDSHDEFRLRIVNIVVALVDVYEERSLTWLPGVCSHDLPNSLLAFVEQSIFQVWQLYHAPFVSYWSANSTRTWYSCRDGWMYMCCMCKYCSSTLFFSLCRHRHSFDHNCPAQDAGRPRVLAH